MTPVHNDNLRLRWKHDSSIHRFFGSAVTRLRKSSYSGTKSIWFIGAISSRLLQCRVHVFLSRWQDESLAITNSSTIRQRIFSWTLFSANVTTTMFREKSVSYELNPIVADHLTSRWAIHTLKHTTFPCVRHPKPYSLGYAPLRLY